MRYRHIIWDWNGTIVDDVSIAISIASRVLLRHGLPELTLERHRRKFEIPIEHYYRAIGLQFTPEQLIELDEEFHREYDASRATINTFPDIAPTLEHIQIAGAGNSVLSALPENLLHRDIKHFALESHFSRVIGRSGKLAGSKVTQGKSLFKELELDPQDVLVIGDTIYDAEVAHALGTDCALLPRGHQDEERLRAAKPTILAPTLADLLEVLQTA